MVLRSIGPEYRAKWAAGRDLQSGPARYLAGAQARVESAIYEQVEAGRICVGSRMGRLSRPPGVAICSCYVLFTSRAERKKHGIRTDP